MLIVNLAEANIIHRRVTTNYISKDIVVEGINNDDPNTSNLTVTYKTTFKMSCTYSLINNVKRTLSCLYKYSAKPPTKPLTKIKSREQFLHNSQQLSIQKYMIAR